MSMKAVALVSAIMVSLAIGQQQREAGMYVDQNGTLTKLAEAPHPSTRIKSKIVKATGLWIFRGAEAAVQIPVSHPHFIIYGSSERFVIVRLENKSDHRELQAASASLLGAHGGFDPKKTIDTTATKRFDGGFDLSFKPDLEPGEYLISTEVPPREAYDFGIQGGGVTSK